MSAKTKLLKNSDSSGYMSTKEITYKDYLEFIRTKSEVVIENTKIKFQGSVNVKSFEPENFSPERTIVWSFPERGSWATHKGNYRGNWSHYIPRNLILKYTKESNWVLDQMMGNGIGRNTIAWSLEKRRIEND